MQQLDPSGIPQTAIGDLQFLLIGDPSNPNGGLLERFYGFETTSGTTVHDPTESAEPGRRLRRRHPVR